MSDDKPAADAPKKKKGGLVKKLLMFVGLPLVLLGGGAGVGIYAAGAGIVGGGAGGEHAKKAHHMKLEVKEGQDGPTELPEGAKVDPSVYKSTYFAIEQPFTSNLRDTDGFLQMGLGVSTFYGEEATKQIEDSSMPLRSAVLEVLAESDAEALNTPAGKASLRKRLKGAINHVLEQREGFATVDDVYFTSFIIQ
jgi:flagellar protein FliL